MAKFLFFILIALIALHMAFGPAVVLTTGCVMLIIFFCRDMIWSARRRNDKELHQFQLVNAGLKEPHPSFLMDTWK